MKFIALEIFLHWNELIYSCTYFIWRKRKVGTFEKFGGKFLVAM